MCRCRHNLTSDDGPRFQFRFRSTRVSFHSLFPLSRLGCKFQSRDNFFSPTILHLQLPFFSSLLLFVALGTKREERKAERKRRRGTKREREEDFGGYFRQKQANARTRDRIVAGRVSLIRHRGITYGSLMSPYQRYLPIPWAFLLPPVPTRMAPLDFQLPAPLTYTHL